MRRTTMTNEENNKRRFGIEEKNGTTRWRKYFTNLTLDEFVMLKNIISINLGKTFHSYYGIDSSSSNRDVPNNITEQNIEEFFTEIKSKTNKTERKFLDSLDYKDVISFILKYGHLYRGVNITKTIITKVERSIPIPEHIDMNCETSITNNSVDDYMNEVLKDERHFNVRSKKRNNPIMWEKIKGKKETYDYVRDIYIYFNTPTINEITFKDGYGYEIIQERKESA